MARSKDSRPTSRVAREARGPFERVWEIAKRIPRGRVATYGQLAQMIGRRLSPVAIGWAIRAAAPGAIPWHRVINSRGGISTDREHPGRQRSLLEAEGVAFGDDGLVDLDRFGWRPREKATAPPRRGGRLS